MFEARQVAGSNNYKQIKQFEIVLSVCLFSHEHKDGLFI